MLNELQKIYNKDFYSWTMENANLLRQGKFSEIDIEHIAEELESMGKSDKRELASRLAILIAHLLKWQFQPTMRGTSWQLTIKAQRIGVLRLLRESPSLKYQLDAIGEDAYEEAKVLAAKETGLVESTFPAHCPFTFDQCLESRFLPEE